MAGPQKTRKLKPEQVLVAKKHPPKKAKSPPKKKHPSKRKWLTRKLRVSKRATLTLLLIGSIAAWCVVTGLYILSTRSEASPPLDTQAIVDQRRRSFEAKYGTEQERLQEIDFIEKTEADLRAYVLADYTELKQNCRANEQYVYIPRYRLERVVRGTFALVVKDCGGEQKAILAKSSTGWAEVYSGNSVPPCELVNQLHIPHGIADTCLTEGVLYSNPAP